MMNVRRSVLVVVAVAFLSACSLFSLNQDQPKAGFHPAKIADGGAPLPPIPKGRGVLFVA